jgi:hypothetical protein
MLSNAIRGHMAELGVGFFRSLLFCELLTGLFFRGWRWNSPRWAVITPHDSCRKLLRYRPQTRLDEILSSAGRIGRLAVSQWLKCFLDLQPRRSIGESSSAQRTEGSIIYPPVIFLVRGKLEADAESRVVWPQ